MRRGRAGRPRRHAPTTQPAGLAGDRPPHATEPSGQNSRDWRAGRRPVRRGLGQSPRGDVRGSRVDRERHILGSRSTRGHAGSPPQGRGTGDTARATGEDGTQDAPVDACGRGEAGGGGGPSHLRGAATGAAGRAHRRQRHPRAAAAGGGAEPEGAAAGGRPPLPAARGATRTGAGSRRSPSCGRASAASRWARCAARATCSVPARRARFRAVLGGRDRAASR